MKIVECNKPVWDAFVDKSPQGIVFCKSFFIESYKKDVRYLQCVKGREAYGGFAFVETSKSIQPMPFHAYCGIILKDLSDLKLYKQNDLRFSVLSCFAEYLFNNYNEIYFMNHWDIIDFRPFEWLNYHQKEKGFYRIGVRYTSFLDISEPSNISDYARLRTRDLKKGIKTAHFATKESNDIELLSRLNDMNFKRQGIARKKDEVEALANICKNLIQANAGKLLVTNVNDEPAIASFFVYDRFRAYHLFAGTDIRFRDLGVGTKNLYDCCSYLNKILGITELDMAGVNSPQRGHYKLSYGGNIVPYYHVTKILPQ
jgi:hypothetical protein